MRIKGIEHDRIYWLDYFYRFIATTENKNKSKTIETSIIGFYSFGLGNHLDEHYEYIERFDQESLVNNPVIILTVCQYKQAISHLKCHGIFNRQ